MSLQFMQILPPLSICQPPFYTTLNQPQTLVPILSVQGRTLWPIGIPESESMLSVLLLRPIPTCAHFAFCPNQEAFPFPDCTNVQSLEGKHWVELDTHLWRDNFASNSNQFSTFPSFLYRLRLQFGHEANKPMWKMQTNKGQKLPRLSQFRESAQLSMYFGFCDDNPPNEWIGSLNQPKAVKVAIQKDGRKVNTLLAGWCGKTLGLGRATCD